MIITVEGLQSEQESRKFSDNEFNMILPKLFEVVKKNLRDIDLVGTIAAFGDETVFALLTMTGQDGAAIARERILKKIAALSLKIGATEFRIAFAISITAPPVSEKKYGSKTYLEAARINHEAIVQSQQHF
jgi:GGDEF domain-containing protein